MWSREVLKNRAKDVLRNNYWKSVLVALLLAIATGQLFNSDQSAETTSSTEGLHFKFAGIEIATYDNIELVQGLLPYIGIGVTVAVITTLALGLLVFNPLMVGCQKYFYQASCGDADLNHLGYGFKNQYGNMVKVLFFRDLVVFLWGLLFIIPGIVKSYAYRMVPFLLAEDPYLTPREAREISARMMDGEKLNVFVLDLSFILWNILSGLTLGLVGIFWVLPYQAHTDAELYKVLRDK